MAKRYGAQRLLQHELAATQWTINTKFLRKPSKPTGEVDCSGITDVICLRVATFVRCLGLLGKSACE